MTNIFVVTGDISYEPGYLVGAFPTHMSAVQGVITDIHSYGGADEYTISEWIVDGEYHNRSVRSWGVYPSITRRDDVITIDKFTIEEITE